MSHFGATPEGKGTRYRLWAPDVEAVALVRPEREPLAMTVAGEGFFEASTDDRAGQSYMFRVDGLDVPDPASRLQAEDADGWSMVRPAMPPPRPDAVRRWSEALIAEVHVGAATPDGTFAGLMAALPRFAEAGYTAIELMPLADFMGRWNWGYDGVLPFAPDRSYGTPDELRALVDAAHHLGLGVIVDVVYNHFGPAGNYLHHYAGAFFAPQEVTPWGPAIALDNPVVRDFFCDNVRMWMADYDVDGLRFDAVHAFRTPGVARFMEELAAAARAVKPNAWLILENDDNAARWLERDEGGRPLRYTAQWNDDFHHAFFVAAGGERGAHYEDYADDPVARSARALAEGFVYQGEVSPHRKAARGEPSAHLPPEAFVSFVQNHDQIGNRPLGDRLVDIVSPEAVACLRFATLLGPHVPMFFMGEEASLSTPFPFFCDFEGDLAEAVRKGRREEFRHFFDGHPGSPDDLPDPLAETTFSLARIGWDTMADEAHKGDLETFRSLAAIRRRHVWPLTATEFRGSGIRRSRSLARIDWHFAGGDLTMALALGEEGGTIEVPASPAVAETGSVSQHGPHVTLGPWSGALWLAVR